MKQKDCMFEAFEKERAKRIKQLGEDPEEMNENGYRFTMGNGGDIVDQASRSKDGKGVEVYRFNADGNFVGKEAIR